VDKHTENTMQFPTPITTIMDTWLSYFISQARISSLFLHC